MSAAIECRGAPRDLGLDQGRACAEVLRARFAARPWWERLWLHTGPAGRERARLVRDLRRYFPHQSESLAGMAVGADVPVSWLARELREEPAGSDGEGSVAVALTGPRTLLARGLGVGWVVRRSLPEGLFGSVEATSPWLTAALAGLNQRGLAVAVVGASGATPGCAVPASLLAQDCLERFEVVEAALGWCLSRPGGGRATLLLADARGDAAGVEISGMHRRLLRPCEGLIVAGGQAARHGGLAGALRENAPFDARALARRISGDAAALDPEARRLVVGGVDFSP